MRLGILNFITDNIGRTTRRTFDNDGFNELDAPKSINLETMDMPLREWIAQDRTRREIKRRYLSQKLILPKHFESL